MAITFAKDLNGAILLIYDRSSLTEGATDTISAKVAGALFADTAVPKVGDVIRFARSWDSGVKRKAEDVPTTISYDGLTYVFGLVNGIAEYIVLTVEGNGAITVRRGAT